MNRKMIVTVLAAMAASPLMAVQGTIRTETDEKTGDIKWQARAKSYSLAYKKGKTDVSAEYPIADVTELIIPVPQGYEKAVELVSKGNGAAAIGTLLKIVSEYRMLNWDKPAGRYLALAYISAGQAQKAYEVCTPIISEDKSAAWKGDLAPAYWQALLKIGKTDQLESLLKKAATSGDRPTAAAALTMRGDIIVAGSVDQADKLKEALRAGYLRVVYMFTDPACSRERVEAAMKAASCFDKLGQASRAEKMRALAKTL